MAVHIKPDPWGAILSANFSRLRTKVLSGDWCNQRLGAAGVRTRRCECRHHRQGQAGE